MDAKSAEPPRCRTQQLTGVSNAITAMMRGQRGAPGSVACALMDMTASAMRSPPMLRAVYASAKHLPDLPTLATDLCPHSTTLALPAPPPFPECTSSSTVSVVSQSTNRSVAAPCDAEGEPGSHPSALATHQVALSLIDWEHSRPDSHIRSRLLDQMLKPLGELLERYIGAFKPVRTVDGLRLSKARRTTSGLTHERRR